MAHKTTYNTQNKGHKMMNETNTYKDSKGNLVRIHIYETGFDTIAMNMDVEDDRDDYDDCKCIIANGRDRRAVGMALLDAGYKYISN